MRGGIKTEIKAKDFLPIRIHLPELEEQKEINSFFDSIDQEMEDVNNELKHQTNYISLLRQSILQEAIEGKLTAAWRKQNPVHKGDPATDAAALLEKIKQEKQKLFAEGRSKKKTAGTHFTRGNSV